jgi:hypothetical protein
MISRYPEEAALYAGALTYYVGSKKSPLVYKKLETRSHAERHRISHDPETRAVKTIALDKALYAISMGRKLEPDNIFYDLCHAYLLYGEGRDAEALAIMHQASTKPQYDSHYQDRIDSALAYGARPVFPINQLCPAWKVIVTYSADFGYVVAFKSIYQLAISGQHRDDPQGTLEMADDIMHIGGVMRDGSDSVIEALVSAYLQRDVIRASDSILQGLSPQWETAAYPSDRKAGKQTASVKHWLSELQANAGSRLPEAKWRQWHDEAAKTDSLRPRFDAYVHSGLQAEWLKKPLVVTIASAKLLPAIILIGFFWSVSWIWLALRRKLDVTGVGPSPFLLWLAILIAAAPMRDYIHEKSYLADLKSLPLLLTIGVGIAAYQIVPIIAILRTRIVPGIGRLDTFAARLRRGCAVVMSGLLMLYVASVIGNFVVAKHVGQQIAPLCSCEMAVVRAIPAGNKE